MDDLLERLETKLRVLIQRCSDLEKDTFRLRENKIMLTHEIDSLQLKHKAAISQIENMVSHLKQHENPQ